MATDNFDPDKTTSFAIIAAGQMVNAYRIVRPLGAGGMGEVYLAEDTRLKRMVAIKFLPAAASQDPDQKARFIGEAQVAATLNHPNVVTVHEVGEFDHRPYFVMEHVEGTNIRELVTAKAMPLPELIGLLRQAADGLHHAHEQGVVHRDVKSSNIVVDHRGRPRLVDFGLAQMLGSNPSGPTSSMAGTIAYMSPEQIRGEPVDHRSDLFSFGCVLYELLMGQSPFRRDNHAATLQAVLDFVPPRPLYLGQPIPEPLWQLLDSLLAKSPAERCQSAADLIAALNALQTGVTGEPHPIATADRPSIAILPFANMSDDPHQEFVCDGIAEDIIHNLGRVPGLRVLARTSAFAFKGKNEDVREIGRRLGVTSVLEGGVRRLGNRLRITAQLINVADGFHQWAERYDREATDLFAIQDDIARAVAETLQGYLLPSSGKKQPEQRNLAAYEQYKRGWHLMELRTTESFLQARDIFVRLVAEHPDYNLGHVGLAQVHFLISAYELADPHAAIAHARTAVLEVLRRDDTLAEAHAVYGGILTFYDWSWDEAEQEFQRALTLNPGYATAHLWYGELLGHRRRLEDAERHFVVATELDPLSEIVQVMHGEFLYLAGRGQEAIPLYRKAIDQGSRNDVAYLWLGFALLHSGRTNEASEWFEKACQVSGRGSYAVGQAGHGAALLGDLSKAREALDELTRRRETEYVSTALLAVLHLDLGEKEAGYALLKEALRRHVTELIFMAAHPHYEPLRRDPVVRTLLEVVGLPMT